MSHTIRLIAGLRVLMDTKQIQVKLPESATIRDLLVAIQQDFPRLAGRILDDGVLNPELLIVVNGEPIHALHGLATPLLPSDDVMMIPPLMGG